MKIRQLQWMAALVAMIATVVPTPVFAAAPKDKVPVTIDVTLRDGGVFVGQVVDSHGAVRVGQTVAVAFDGQEIVRTQTDENGAFAVQGLRGGQYVVTTDSGMVSTRLWAADTAPPTSRPAALIVSGQMVANGQAPGGGIISWIQAHPFATTAGVAAAVAVPVVIASDDDDNS